MGLDGGKVDVKVFVEGVEIPVLGVSVTERLGGVAQANIAVPYIRALKDILVRSLVHIFYYDETEIMFWPHDVPEGTPPEDVFPPPEIDEGLNLHHYKLLFWGELAGVSRMESAAQSQGSMTCLGFSNYYDTIKQVSALRGRGTLSDVERRFAGIENEVSTGSSGQYSTADRITQLLREGSQRTIPASTTYEGQVASIIRQRAAEGGDTPSPGAIHTEGIPFVNSASIYNGLRERGVDLPRDYIRRYGRMMRAWNEGGEEAMVAAATHALRTEERTVGDSADFQTGLRALIREFIEGTNEFYRNRSDVIRLPDMLKAIPNDDSAESLMNLDVFKRFMRQTIGGRGIYTIRQVLQIVGRHLFHDHVEHATPTYFPFISRRAQQALERDEMDEAEAVVDRDEQVDEVSGIVFKPELWWSCPPACNVLFPSHYGSIQDGHNQIAEPTRTLLKISPGVSGSRNTIADDFFAPDLQSLNSLALETETSSQEVFQLPYERFRGINYNVVMMGEELARLSRRDGYQDYMRSYAQFTHWKSVYHSRTVQVNSQRLLPWVLVGYPAVAIDKNIVERAEPVDDPYLEERMLLRRELAALRRCLRRLRARRRALLEELSRAEANANYIEWINNNRPAVYAGDERWSETQTEDIVVDSEDPFGLVTPTPAFNMTAASIRARDLDPGETTGDPVNVVPAYHEETLRNALGDSAQPIVQVEGNISLNTLHEDAADTLSGMSSSNSSYVDRLRAQIARLDALIARVTRAIRELRDRLLELGWDLGTYEHTLFYVESKTITINKGSVATSIGGRFAHAHDEDIDYDGTRGDTFENIIKTGPGEFFSDNYSSDQIGANFYLPTYGVKSLIDHAVELQPLTEHEDDALDDEILTEADEELPYWREVLRDVCQRDFDATTAAEGMSIEDALEILVEVYRSIGLNTRDVESFVSHFVARPIATIVDILGADILEGDPTVDASYLYGNYQGSQLNAGAGYHQFAFLAEDETFDMSGLEGRESDQLHVATLRRSRVLDYVREMTSRDFTE